MMKVRLVSLILVLLCGTVSAVMRVWTDAGGDLIEGEYMRVESSDVIVKDRSGKYHLIPIKALSGRDTEYLKSVFVPDMTISVSEESRIPWRSEIAWADDKIEMVKGIVRIRSKSKIPVDTLRAEAYLIGAEVATPDYRIKSRTSQALRFTKENNFTVEFEVEEMQSRQYVEYNFQTRGTLYAGYLVLVLNRKNEVVDYQTNISWLTEEKLPLLRQFRVDTFFNENCQKRPVPRPDYVESREGFKNWGQ